MCRDTAALDIAVDGKTLNFTVSIGAAEAARPRPRQRRSAAARGPGPRRCGRARPQLCAVLAAHPGVLEMDEVIRNAAEEPAPDTS